MSVEVQEGPILQTHIYLNEIKLRKRILKEALIIKWVGLVLKSEDVLAPG